MGFPCGSAGKKSAGTAREKQQITPQGIPIRITAALSIETFQARRNVRSYLE